MCLSVERQNNLRIFDIFLTETLCFSVLFYRFLDHSPKSVLWTYTEKKTSAKS